MWNMSRSRGSAVLEEAADRGRDLYDDRQEYVSRAGERARDLIHRLRDDGGDAQARAVASLEDALDTLSHRGRGAFRTVSDAGQDGWEAATRLGRRGLTVVGLRREPRWWERLGLPLDDIASAFERRKLQSALSNTPVISDLARRSYLDDARSAFDRLELPDARLPRAITRPFKREERRLPVAEICVVAALGALVWYFFFRKTNRDEQAHDAVAYRPLTGAPAHSGAVASAQHPRETGASVTDEIPVTLGHTPDNALKHPSVDTKSYSLRGDSPAGAMGGSGAHHHEPGRNGSSVMTPGDTAIRPVVDSASHAALMPPGSVFMPSPSATAADRTAHSVEGKGDTTDSRDDDDVLADVQQALMDDALTQATAPTGIQASVSNGRVTLRGVVPNPNVKRRAEERAAGVDGVLLVVNELEIGQHV